MSEGGPGATVVANGAARPPRRHDPRIDPPTRQDKRRLWAWIALLGFTPVCLAGVAWAALGLNGSYPTVRPPVPAGWKAVRGIYASISVPKSWSLQETLSDSAGDIYYSSPGGGVGMSVVEADHEPSHTGRFPPIVGVFLGGGKFQVSRLTSLHLPGATRAWGYRFRLPGGGAGTGVLAWAKPTETRIWLVTNHVTTVTGRIFSTLTLAR